MARGSIVTRQLNDGRKRYDTVIRINGKQQWRTFKKKKDAEGYLDRNSTDVREHTYRKTIPATFAQYADRWRRKYLIPQELKPSTLSVYAYILDKHLIPRFGPSPMAAITTADVTEFRADLLKSNRASQYVKKLLNLLGRCFGDAIEDGYMKVSPMPQRRQNNDQRAKACRRGKALQPEQAQRLLEQCGETLRLIVLIGLLAGLRRGEIFSLHWMDLDWDANQIHVRRNLFWRYGKHHDLEQNEPSFLIDTPKSEKSVRDVDLSPALKKEFRTRYLKSKDKRGLVFQTGKATPLDPNTVSTRWFKPAVERSRHKAQTEDNEAMQAFDGLTMHDLRHTFGSWKVAQGEDILYVSAQMGHARPSITMDIYSHLLEKRRPAAAAKTDDLLFGVKVAAAD